MGLVFKRNRTAAILGIIALIIIFWATSAITMAVEYDRYTAGTIGTETLQLTDKKITKPVEVADEFQKEKNLLRQERRILPAKNNLFRAWAANTVWKGPPSAVESKMVTISFDDLTTLKVKTLIQTANAKKAPLLLFPTGDSLQKQPDVFKFAIASGHTIGNHTDHHDWLGKLTETQILKTISDWDTTASKLLGGYQTVFLRPPAMSGWTSDKQRARLEKAANAAGKIPILWNLESYYDLYAPNGPHRKGLNPTIADETDYIVKTAKPGDIILFHDTAADVTALPVIIDGLRAKGLRIVSIETMLDLKK